MERWRDGEVEDGMVRQRDGEVYRQCDFMH